MMYFFFLGDLFYEGDVKFVEKGRGDKNIEVAFGSFFSFFRVVISFQFLNGMINL